MVRPPPRRSPWRRRPSPARTPDGRSRPDGSAGCADPGGWGSTSWPSGVLLVLLSGLLGCRLLLGRERLVGDLLRDDETTGDGTHLVHRHLQSLRRVLERLRVLLGQAVDERLAFLDLVSHRHTPVYALLVSVVAVATTLPRMQSTVAEYRRSAMARPLLRFVFGAELTMIGVRHRL